jgi:hypothetical protein
MHLPMRAIGREIDLSWKPLTKLSYAPWPNFRDDTPNRIVSGGFGAGDREQFWDLQNGTGNTRVPLPDGTKISPQELAIDSVFNAYRIEFQNAPTATQNSNGEWGIKVPTLPYMVTRKQIVLSNELAQMWTDDRNVLHKRPAFISGVFFGNLVGGALSNYPDGTRIDKQSAAANTSEDEPASFSSSLDPVDTDRSIITVNPKLVKQVASTFGPNAGQSTEWVEADLLYTCAFQVRDPETWQPNRYEFLYQIGSGTDTNFAATYVHDDIQPVVIGQYEARNQRTLTDYKTNFGEVITQCQYYAESVARKFVTVTSEHKTYIGLFPIDMDGAICQITYMIDKSGASTVASQGTEHNPYTPEYEERRKMTARQGISQRLDFVKYEVARRTAYLGNVNT